MSQPAIDVSSRYQQLLELDQHQPLLQYGGVWTTIGQVREAVVELDRLLTGAGLGEASMVGLITRNRPPQVTALLATLATGRCLVPITSIQSDAGVAADVERLGVAVLVADDEDWKRDGLIEQCQRLGVLGIEVSGKDGLRVAVVDHLASSTVRAERRPGVAVLMPTSGTTGPPKRITYQYGQLNGALARIAQYSAATGRTLMGPVTPQKGVVIATLALAHVGGFWAVFQALAEGRAIALLDRFEPNAWADLVEEHGARLSSLPPTTIRMVLDADVAKEKLSTLLAVGCGTAPLDPEVGDAFTEKYGVPVLTAYGATEFPGGLVGWTLDDYRKFRQDKRGAAGRPRPGIKLRIVDAETGAVLAPGEQGLVSVLSPQATAASEDGWVRTNDIGKLDEDNFLWILGRADDAINRGGFKIVPQTVEAILEAHPAVVEAAVAGIPDRRLGQVPVAAVTVRSPVSGDELVTWAREQLPTYQVPVVIRVVDELPRTTSMKVSKDGVRALFTATT